MLLLISSYFDFREILFSDIHIEFTTTTDIDFDKSQMSPHISKYKTVNFNIKYSYCDQFGLLRFHFNHVLVDLC
jgi:hypothetical protein